jgi:hypothetical protein
MDAALRHATSTRRAAVRGAMVDERSRTEGEKRVKSLPRNGRVNPVASGSTRIASPRAASRQPPTPSASRNIAVVSSKRRVMGTQPARVTHLQPGRACSVCAPHIPCMAAASTRPAPASRTRRSAPHQQDAATPVAAASERCARPASAASPRCRAMCMQTRRASAVRRLLVERRKR